MLSLYALPRLVIERSADGQPSLVGEWPAEFVLSRELLESPPPGMRVEAGQVRFALVNGSAVYRRLRDLEYGKAALYRMITASRWPAAGQGGGCDA